MNNLTATSRGVPVPRRSEGGSDGPDEIDDGILYWSERTVVRRILLPDGGGTAIHKQALGLSAVERTRHERSVLTRLKEVAEVPHLLDGGTDDTLVLEDLGGRQLAKIISSGDALADPVSLCDLALRLAHIIGAIHAAGVIHRDLNPANVLVRIGPTAKLEPIVVDFDLATTLAQVRPSFVDPREIAGRLPYLAPEQTGRTGTQVDQRSDLYALGALLYELATSTSPFEDDDPLRLIGQILTRCPKPPDQLTPQLPAMFSQIIIRLLQKEPGDRYFSASGLAHDLAQVVADPEHEFTLGLRDFPQRLTPPTRLVGRDRELRQLTEALDQAAAGAVQGVLVSGGPGVGKSALIDQLRPLVAARGGWFTTGKADQYRNDSTTSLFADAMSQLTRSLLAEPEHALVTLRERVLKSLGDNAGLITALVPGSRQLLGVEPEQWPAQDASTISARLLQAAPDLLRGIVSPRRPLVLFLDDLQWATVQALETIELLLADVQIQGLVIIGAYRHAEVDATHPLTGMIERWERLGIMPPQLRLPNLARDDLTTLIAEMLRLPNAAADASELAADSANADASELATVLAERTAGNPLDTVELINALRKDGALVLGEEGWTWQAQTIRGYVGTGDVVDLLTDRIAQLPRGCRAILRTMARLGAGRHVTTLAAACALESRELFTQLLPALDDGLVIADEGVREGTACRGECVIRFRHDRVQQAAYEDLPEADRIETALVLARRLATTDDLDATAQEYLEVVDHLTEPREQRRVVELFHAAATSARRASMFAFVDRYLEAAAELHARSGGTPDDPLTAALDAERHATLYSLGRLDEADGIYARVSGRTPQAIELADPACLQIASLTNRSRFDEAFALGLGLLERLGVPRPAGDLRAVAAEGFDRIERWLDKLMPVADAARTEATNPTALAAGAVLKSLCHVTALTDRLLLGWLVTESQRLWADHGPQPDLVPCLANSNSHELGIRASTDLDHRFTVHVLRVGEALGYRGTTAQGHFIHSLYIGYQYEPLEDLVAEARNARETLRRLGDQQGASLVFAPTMIGLLDCGQTLDVVLGEAEAAFALAQRTGNDLISGISVAFRQLTHALRGDTHEPTRVIGNGFDEDSHLAAVMRTNAVVGFHVHQLKALAAAFFADAEGLTRHLAARRPLLGLAAGTYASAVDHLLAGLSAARQLQAGTGSERTSLLATLDAAHHALATVAVTAPANFRHLERFLDAERARATGEVATALRSYDEALRAADDVTRPWHHALIAERAGAFGLATGYERWGRSLIVEARRRYRDWGATAKVVALDNVYPWARTRRLDASSMVSLGSLGASVGVTSDAIDMLAILAASQAIGSQTDPDQLHTVVVEHLRALTGATDVLVVVPDDSGRWHFQPGQANAEPIAVETAGDQGLLPLGAFRYTERTREPLLVPNAATDSRFARDAYVASRTRCSLLVVPILKAGALRAVLILTNDLRAEAFTTERLDAVQLIAGQLAVSLDNAMLYRSLEAKVASRTEALQTAKEQLELLSVTDALTDIANRRQFDIAWHREWERAVAHSRSLAILMIDIDHFKQYNDTFGHLAGDECIQAVATALAGSVRTSDVVCRYGGEEFAIILPTAELQQAFVVAQRAHAAVRALGIPHPGDIGRVTVSIGVAARVPSQKHGPQTLIAVADAALYEAKRTGRDQVVTMSP